MDKEIQEILDKSINKGKIKMKLEMESNDMETNEIKKQIWSIS